MPDSGKFLTWIFFPLPDFWQKLACFWQINAISGQNWQKSYLIAVRFMNLIARILLETAQNLARFWHKTGVPLSIWKFQIKKKYIYFTSRSFFFFCSLASFVPVSCKFLASCMSLLGIELWILFTNFEVLHSLVLSTGL